MRSVLLAFLWLLVTGCAQVQDARDAVWTPRVAMHCVAPDSAARAAVVALQTADGGHGSGIIVGDDLVLTAAHVLGAESTALVQIGAIMVHARVLALEHEQDLALLHVSTAGRQAMGIATTEPAVSQPVWALGFPRARGQRTSRGRFESIQGGRLFSTAEVDNGDSGGGLLQCKDGNYTLAGMIRSYAAYRIDGQLVKVRGLSIAVPAASIRTFVRAHAI